MFNNEPHHIKNLNQDKNTIGFALNWFSLNGQELKRGGTAPILDNSRRFSGGSGCGAGISLNESDISGSGGGGYIDKQEGDNNKCEFRDVTINNLKTGIKTGEEYTAYQSQQQRLMNNKPNNTPQGINSEYTMTSNTTTTTTTTVTTSTTPITATTALKNNTNNLSKISKIYSNGSDQITKKKPKNDYRNLGPTKHLGKSPNNADHMTPPEFLTQSMITTQPSKGNTTPNKANNNTTGIIMPSIASPTSELNKKPTTTAIGITMSNYSRRMNPKHSRIVSAALSRPPDSNLFPENSSKLTGMMVDHTGSKIERTNVMGKLNGDNQKFEKRSGPHSRGHSLTDGKKRLIAGGGIGITGGTGDYESSISTGIGYENNPIKEKRSSATNETSSMPEERKNTLKYSKNLKKPTDFKKDDHHQGNTINDFTDFDKDNNTNIEPKALLVAGTSGEGGGGGILANIPENQDSITGVRIKTEKSTQESSQNGSATNVISTIPRVSNRNLLSSQHNREAPVEINFEFLNELHNQRPPCRKKGPTFGLDDRYAAIPKQIDIITTEKKSPIMPVKAQHTIIRPPSRHKTPTKALGLDLPNDVIEAFPVKKMYVKGDDSKKNSRMFDHAVDTDEDEFDDEDFMDKSNDILKTGFIDSSSDDELDLEEDFDNFNNDMLDFSGFLNKDLDKDEERNIQFVNPAVSDLYEIRRDIKTSHGKRVRPGQTENKEQGKNSLNTNHHDGQSFTQDDQEKTIQIESYYYNRRGDYKNSPMNVSKPGTHMGIIAGTSIGSGSGAGVGPGTGNSSVKKGSDRPTTLKVANDSNLNSRKCSQKRSIEVDSHLDYNNYHYSERSSNSINFSVSPDNKRDLMNLSNYSNKNRPSTTKVNKTNNNSIRNTWNNNLGGGTSSLSTGGPSNNSGYPNGYSTGYGNIMNNNYIASQKEKSKIIITHNKNANINKNNNNITLPFETSLGKDFVSLFAN